MLTEEQKATFIARIQDGATIKQVAQDFGLPRHIFAAAMQRDALLRREYLLAREIAQHVLTEEIPEIARKESDVRRADIIIKGIQWLAARMAPKVYGDRIDLNVTQTIDLRGTLDRAKGRLVQPVSNQPQLTDMQDAEFTVLPNPRPIDTASMPAPPKDEGSIFD